MCRKTIALIGEHCSIRLEVSLPRHSGYFEAQSRLCGFALLFILHVFHCKLSSEITRCPPQKKYCARKKASSCVTQKGSLSNMDNHS